MDGWSSPQHSDAHVLWSPCSPASRWSCRRRRLPLSTAFVPPQGLSVSPADSLLVGCFHLSGDVLFIALTLYFEVLPIPVGRPVREIRFSQFSIPGFGDWLLRPGPSP